MSNIVEVYGDAVIGCIMSMSLISIFMYALIHICA